MQIVNMEFGSHLYGTSTPNSDRDYKGIFLPSYRDIILQQVQDVTSTQRPKSFGEKNVADENDTETYSLQKFFKLVEQGQTVALDMLFAPSHNIIEKTNFWDQIQKHRSRLVSRKSDAFVGYVFTQAKKYGIKGSRVAAARYALNTLDRMCQHYPRNTKLSVFLEAIDIAVLSNPEYMSIVDIPQKTSGHSISHWDVCGRKMSFNASIGNSLDIMKNVVENYGSRALMAEKNEGVDWKALSHAVRVANQAIELFDTGNITFPLKNVKHILDIKLGRISYAEVANELEDLVDLVKAASSRSSLPSDPDSVWIENFVFAAYKSQAYRTFKYQN